MKLNAKTLKGLRGAAGFRNQSATPGVVPFPGVARMYQHPVYSQRVTTKTGYVRLPMEDKTTKVFTRVRRMVVDNRGKAVQMMETLPAGTVPVRWEKDAEGKEQPVEFNKYAISRPKMQLVPVTKPARLDPKCPKAVYRGLKRLAAKGLLNNVAAGIIAAEART